MTGPDDISLLKRKQEKQGHAIGGIKSCLGGYREQNHELSRRLYAVETLCYALVVFIAVFYCVMIFGR